MTRAGCTWVQQGLMSLCLVLLVLAGCSSGGGDSENADTVSGMSRVTLQMDVADLPGESSTLRATSAPQLRQTELITLIKVEVTGDGIDAPIVVSCPLAGSLPPECTDNSTANDIIISVNLLLPTGSTPTITVTAFAGDVPLYEGQKTTTLGSVEETVTILLGLVEIRQVLPQDLANKTFVFPDGAAFGFPGAEVTLQFLGSFFKNTDGLQQGAFVLQSGSFIAGGTIILASCELQADGFQGGNLFILEPCEVDAEGRLQVTHDQQTSRSNPPTVSLSLTDAIVSATEGDSGTTNTVFTVTLSAASSQEVRVNFATADGVAVAGTDYQATSGTLIFAPGSTQQTITVAVNGDVLDEVDENFLLNLSGPVNATIFPTPLAQGIILDDDDPPTLSVDDVTVAEGNGGTTNAVFTVTLSAPSSHPVSVDFSTADGSATVAGSDYVAIPLGTLNFAPGTTTQSISVVVNGDMLDELDETFTVNLSNPTNVSIVDSQGVGTIQDDDPPPTLSINDVMLVEGDSGTTDMVFSVTLSAASSQQVTVDFATANDTAAEGADYQGPSGTLTFAPGQISQMIMVPVVGDVLDEADETFFVDLSNWTNATIADARGVGTIQDDDTPLSISDATVVEGDSGTTTDMIFTVTLDGASSLPVSVDYATVDGTATTSDSDYQATNGSLNFPPGTTRQTQNITVVINGDTNLDEAPDETFFVNLINPTNAALAPGQERGMGMITNDDFALYSVSPNDNCLREINPADASIKNSMPITIPGGLAAGFILIGANGLATDPQTGELWALLTLQNSFMKLTVEELVVINPATGVATSATSPPSMGNTNDRFVALAFDDAGTRYGLTDSIATSPNTLFMDILDPSSNLCTVTHLGGHALAYDNGLLYHASGGDRSTIDLSFESLTDPITMGGACSTTTPVKTKIFEEVGALTHSPFANEFFLVAGSSLYRLTPAGVVSSQLTLGDGTVRSKGLAFNGFSIGKAGCVPPL